MQTEGVQMHPSAPTLPQLIEDGYVSFDLRSLLSATSDYSGTRSLTPPVAVISHKIRRTRGPEETYR